MKSMQVKKPYDSGRDRNTVEKKKTRSGIEANTKKKLGGKERSPRMVLRLAKNEKRDLIEI